MASESNADVAQEVTITLLRVINKIAQGRRTTRDYGPQVSMTLVEAEMCLLISNQPGVTGAELSEELGVSRSATSQVITKLKSKGFVTEVHDFGDAKRKQLFVSELGQQAAEIAQGYAGKMTQELYGATSRKELESYRRFVTKLEDFHDGVRKQWNSPAD